VPQRDEVRGERRKLHNKELNNLYSSPKIVWVIKLRRIRWERHAARIGTVVAYTGVWWGTLRARNHLEDPGLD